MVFFFSDFSVVPARFHSVPTKHFLINSIWTVSLHLVDFRAARDARGTSNIDALCKGSGQRAAGGGGEQDDSRRRWEER